MRILHIITRMILGGAQENTLLSVLGQQEKHDVLLLTGPTTGPEGCILPELTEREGRYSEEPTLVRALHPLKDLQAYGALRRFIRAYKPDVVHTHSSKAGILGRLAAWHEKVPAVIHTIHGLPFHPYQKLTARSLYIAAERFAARHCHRLVCVADAMRDQALAAGVGRAEQYRTVYSGMRVENFLRRDVDRTALRARYKIPPQATVLAKVARLFELKGHEYLLEAFARLAGRYPDLHLFLIGGGIREARFQAEAAARGLADRIHFAGLVPREDLPAALAIADGIVHCSLREGLARVLPQAYLSEKPVISFDVDGAREVVKNGETGWLIPPRDIDALTQAIREWQDNPGRAAAYAATGCARCRERFDWRTMVRQLDDVYSEVLKSSSTNAGSTP